MNDVSSDRTDSYDVVVIGGGAAGLSAALVLTRALRRVAVVDTGQPRNAPAAQMHGFLGSDGLPPAALLSRGREEVARYGGNLVAGMVVDVVPYADGDGRCFDVTLLDGSTLRARRVLITTGLRDELPDIPGVLERWGRDLLHCPYCHGYEVRDQPLGVLGGTLDAVQHALLIRQWSDDVVFFAHDGTLSAQEREHLDARRIGVVDGLVAGLVVEGDRLVAVALQSGEVVPRAAVFIRPTMSSNADLMRRMGCAAGDDGWVLADAAGRTSVPGAWVAGNASNPRAQVITAASEGSAAAVALNADLVEEDVARAVADHRASRPA
jgi:thioredoxin reductase